MSFSASEVAYWKEIGVKLQQEERGCDSPHSRSLFLVLVQESWFRQRVMEAIPYLSVSGTVLQWHGCPLEPPTSAAILGALGALSHDPGALGDVSLLAGLEEAVDQLVVKGLLVSETPVQVGSSSGYTLEAIVGIAGEMWKRAPHMRGPLLLACRGALTKDPMLAHPLTTSQLAALRLLALACCCNTVHNQGPPVDIQQADEVTPRGPLLVSLRGTQPRVADVLDLLVWVMRYGGEELFEAMEGSLLPAVLADLQGWTSHAEEGHMLRDIYKAMSRRPLGWLLRIVCRMSRDQFLLVTDEKGKQQSSWLTSMTR